MPGDRDALYVVFFGQRPLVPLLLLGPPFFPSSAIVSACRAMGLEIDSRQGIASNFKKLLVSTLTLLMYRQLCTTRHASSLLP
jgi:hypothetical protein